ncbi:hypothetical protein [Actinoplanes sp. HUAS TT8]|uniref:hypothetical protein n=1 Tax=Actinoplanes sp. HUAS TT8 TaxID=3447453 RepID=UPI003F520458
MRKLWYAGAGVIAGGLLFLGAAPAQADVTYPDPSTYTDPVGDVLARTNGLHISSPIGTDPLGREPLLTVSQNGQQLYPIKPGQRPDRPESGGEDSRRSLPAADVVGTELPRTPRVPFTDANTGAVRLPLVGSLPVVGGILPDGSHTLESSSTDNPYLGDVRGLPKRLADTNRLSLAGLPLGGSPVSPADLLPEGAAASRPTVGASPYSSTPARPGIVSPSPVVIPSSEVPVSVAPSAVSPSAVSPSAEVPSASVAPSEAPYSKVDDPRMLEEPIEGLTSR